MKMFLAPLLLGSLSLINAAYAGSLTLTLDNVRSDQGTLMIAVYSNSAGYESVDPMSAAIQIALPAVKGTSDITLSNVPNGEYAMVIFHDENSNGTLDMAESIPTEGYGYSGATDKFTIPNFESASTSVGDSGGEAKAQLTYLN
jgi:uncharacterized protein (DUF2141 family)